MSFILTIEAAVAGASVCLSENGTVKGLKKNAEQTESAAWLHVAIQQMLHEQERAINRLNAIAVSAGPGSYTGLRVGMAAAKGLCYALQLPLIAVNTLQLMAAAAAEPPGLLCPMIDARRLEVFTAVYTKGLEEVLPAQALVLQSDSFAALLETGTITFFGNGSMKFQPLLQHPNAVFKTIHADASHMAALAFDAFTKKNFCDLAYSEPFYGKAFYSPATKS